MYSSLSSRFRHSIYVSIVQGKASTFVVSCVGLICISGLLVHVEVGVMIAFEVKREVVLRFAGDPWIIIKNATSHAFFPPETHLVVVYIVFEPSNYEHESHEQSEIE